jgi:hypothetical protein
MLRAAMIAERDGDFARALTLLKRAREPQIVEWKRQLQALARFGADADPWLWGRWLGHAAVRWLQAEPRKEVADLARVFACAALPYARPEDVAWAMLTQPLVLEAALFDRGLFDEFLTQVVTPRALAAVPHATGWTGQAAQVLRCVEQDALSLSFSVRDGTAVLQVRDAGTGTGPKPGDIVLGRPLRVVAREPSVFVTPPLLLTPSMAEGLHVASSETARPALIGQSIRRR